MQSRLFFIVLFALSSCAFFRSPHPLDKDTEKLLPHLRAQGEGRGRLTLTDNQHLFSYEAVLQENSDWLLAVEIPLHGEEVLTLKNLRSDKQDRKGNDSLRDRIEKGISDSLGSRPESTKLSRDFLNELRSMIKLILHKELGKEVRCTREEDQRTCEMDGDFFQISSSPKQLLIKKAVSQNHRLELVAENLTGSFFSKMSFLLLSNDEGNNKPNILSLELFWK